MVVKFVAYIDESGDTGLENVKPQPEKGASEWLVLSCFLVRASDDAKCVAWVKEILAAVKSRARHLHFSDLFGYKKKMACDILAQKDGRFFVVASNKKNIQGYINPRAAKASGHVGTAWLYWWLSRLLLERVTEFCEARVPVEHRDNWKLQIVFSRRGGLMYRDFDRYLTKLHWQSIFKTQVIDTSDLKWSVIDFDEVRVLDHSARAGLQLADVIASAFFTALEQNRPANCDAQYAMALKPRMAFDKSNAVLGFSIKTMPELRRMGLSVEQREVFEFYGYQKEDW